MKRLLAVLLVACGSKESSAPAPEPAKVASNPVKPATAPAPVTAPPVQVAIDVTAKQLFADYDANEISADEKYKGKTLRVVGRIASVGKDVLGDPVVSLATADAGTPVIASFKTDDGLAKLMRGQAIALRCVGKGELLAPQLGDCAIDVEVSSDPDAFIPDPGKAQKVRIELASKADPMPPADEQRAWIDAALAVRNHCRAGTIKGDRLGDLWNTAQLVVRRKSTTFVVQANFDERRKSVHAGRAPQFEIDAKNGRIRAIDAAATALCSP